ncbi:hypothetical protein OH76DRAFT_1482839 [Lentinus brumalis]|uniref:F-box domain-containing protein n=1 Tax=Lentinus brumalis TaxID=2498619 RepID=A0A371DB12_9APHY|nr:hypothetical protein OH76DRAFT_1482839 [Polyporus brumalis]
MDTLSQLPFYFEDALDTPLRDGYLPPELWHEILILLRNRKRALINAGLGCKRWRDFVLPYLYAVVTVNAYWQSKSFLAFFDFLNQHTTIAGCIQELHLAASIYEAQLCDYDLETFVAILPTLTSLHTLSMKHLALVVPKRLLRRLAADERFPFVLRKFTVTGCRSAEYTGYLDTFADFFSLFSADTLHVNGLLVPGNISTDTLEVELADWLPERRVSTNNLVFGERMYWTPNQTDIDLHGFFARLLSPEGLRTTSSTIQPYRALTAQHFHNFLRLASAQSIVSLDLHLVTLVTYAWSENRDAVGRALSSCKCLRYLRLDIPCLFRKRPADPGRSILGPILRLAPPTIQVLGVRVVNRSSNFRYLALWDLPEMDDLLYPGRGALFPVLKRVVVELDYAQRKVLEAAVLPVLSRLRAVGLLTVIVATAPLEQDVFLPAL